MTALIRSVAIAAAAVCTAAASDAQGHARLVSSTPAANSTVAPTNALTLHFSEALAPKFSGAELMKADGDAVRADSSVKAGKVIQLTVPARLQPGAYMVMWHAVASDDGHKTQGSYNFTVH